MAKKHRDTSSHRSMPSNIVDDSNANVLPGNRKKKRQKTSKSVAQTDEENAIQIREARRKALETKKNVKERKQAVAQAVQDIQQFSLSVNDAMELRKALAESKSKQKKSQKKRKKRPRNDSDDDDADEQPEIEATKVTVIGSLASVPQKAHIPSSTLTQGPTTKILHHAPESDNEYSNDTSDGASESDDSSQADENAESDLDRQEVLHTAVKRSQEIEEARSKLPVVLEEQPIMDAIFHHKVTLLVAETGSGKSTQVPQFLYEAGFGSSSNSAGCIVITQPRRVAAVATATRVAQEMGVKLGTTVGYHVRFDKSISADTKIKFVTDGVLLRELQADPLLRRYSVIVLDEAHERRINTDVLIGMLSRIANIRKHRFESGSSRPPLRVVIMSATLNETDFTYNTALFPQKPPVVRVKGRQHSVTVHFAKHTLDDYVTAAIEKAKNIHRRLPPGGILIFMTGRAEVETVIRKLSAECGKVHAKPISKGEEACSSETNAVDSEELHVMTGADVDTDDDEDELLLSKSDKRQVDSYDEVEVAEMAIEEEENVIVVPGSIVDDGGEPPDSPGVAQLEDNEESLEIKEQQAAKVPQDVRILPLYSALPKHEQDKVFESVPEGTRLIVVATNVAETSITIPNIRYVVDCGKQKRRVWSTNTGVSKFEVDWISKAAANQRCGRAGRTGPGHCYRLFSSAVFQNQFKDHEPAEVTTQPLESTVLQMRNLGVPSVQKFPFPTHPGEHALKRAIAILTMLNAFKQEDEQRGHEGEGQLSDIGRSMCQVPIHPRFAKMVLLGQQGGCLASVVRLVAILSVENPVLPEASQKHSSLWHHDQSDALGLLKLLGFFEFESNRKSERQLLEQMAGMGIAGRPLVEAKKLSGYLKRILFRTFPSCRALLTDQQFAIPPNPKQQAFLRQMLLAGFPDQVAMLIRNTPDRRFPFQTGDSQSLARIHPSSCLSKKYAAGSSGVQNGRSFVTFISKLGEEDKIVLKVCSDVSEKWLPRICQGMLRATPDHTKPPRFNNDTDCVEVYHSVKFGSNCWPLSGSYLNPSSTSDRLRALARTFIEGQVWPLLSLFREDLIASPADFARNSPHPRSMAVLRALSHKGCVTRAHMRHIWTEDSKHWLLAETMAWVSSSRRSELKSVWPPCSERADVFAQQQISKHDGMQEEEDSDNGSSDE